MYYCDPDGFKGFIRNLVKEGKDSFFSWFDGGETVDGAFEKGEDIFDRLFLPFAKKHLTRLDTKTALDIGYGSGTKVLPASEHFRRVIGVDVHDQHDYVYDTLVERDLQGDVVLLSGDGWELPVPDNSVDFAFSWVTFLHFESIDMVLANLKEIKRCLKTGGIAVIYFTRLVRSGNFQTKRALTNDIKKERENNEGYREGGPLTKVRAVRLVLSMWKMKELVKEAGLKCVSETCSWSKPEGSRYKVFHGQHGLVIQKPKKRIIRTESK